MLSRLRPNNSARWAFSPDRWGKSTAITRDGREVIDRSPESAIETHDRPSVLFDHEMPGLLPPVGLLTKGADFFGVLMGQHIPLYVLRAKVQPGCRDVGDGACSARLPATPVFRGCPQSGQQWSCAVWLITRGVDWFLVLRITHSASRSSVASFRTSLFYSMDTDRRLPSDSRTGHTSYRYAPSFDCSRRPGPGPAPFEISTWLLPHLI